MAAADSATRTDPSVDEATSPAPRRARRAAGAKAADGKATPRVRAAGQSSKPGAKAAPKSAAKAGTDDEPAELDGDDRARGAPRRSATSKRPSRSTRRSTPNSRSKRVVEPVVAADDDDDDDDDDEVEVGPVVRTAISRAPSSTPQKSGDFEWDDEESEALKQARKDAELTASADSVRAYLKQIGKVPLLNAEQEVELAKRIEAGLYAAERLRRATRPERRSPRSCGATCAGSSATASGPRTTCSRRTCGWWSRWPSATPAAAWRSWT